MLPLEFQFPFDRREWAQASRAILLVTIRRLWWLYGLFVLVFLAVAVIPIVQFLLGQEPFAQAAFSALPWAVLLVFWVSLVYYLPTWIARRIERKYPSFAGQQVRTFSPSGLRWVSPGSTQEYQWSAVYRVVETGSFLLFFLTMSAAQFVPKRAMTPEQLLQLRAMIAQSLPAERLRLLHSAA